MSFWDDLKRKVVNKALTGGGDDGGDDLLGGLGKELAKIDPVAAVTRVAGPVLSDFDKTVGISAVSREATQFAKDIGLTGAVKEVSDVVHGIGKAAEKDPLQYAAIIACIAAAPYTGGASLKLIPYIQATAKVTSKQTSVEDVIKEGAKAYVISSAASAAGDYVAGDPVTGDITGGYVPATGVTGATGSVAVGTAAGNISANIVANAARGGKATVGEIVAAGVSDAGLQYLAQTYTPDWTSLTPKQQAAAIDGVKLVLGDKSAASKLVNDALSTSIQAASRAATAVGYDNPWQKQAAEEGGFTDAKTFKAADKLGITNIGEYDEALKGGFASGDELREAKGYGIANRTDLMDLKSGGFDDLFQLKEARAGGFTEKDDFTDAKYLGIASLDQYNKYKDGSWTDPEEFKQGMTKGFTDKTTYDDATTRGFENQVDYTKGTDLGFKTGQDYKIATENNIDAKTWNENNENSKTAGWDNYAEKVNAEKLGFDDPAMWKYAIAVDLENQGSNVTENYLASQITEIGDGLYALPDNAGLYNKNTGDITDFYGNKLAKGLFEGIISNINKTEDNPFLNRPRPTPATPTSPADALSQAAQVIPDYLQDPSQIAKRKDRGTPYSVNPEWSVLNPQASQNPQTQPQQKPQPLALPNPEVVQSGLFSGILSPYNPQNQQGGPYG
jgi:hypothetical protein